MQGSWGEYSWLGNFKLTGQTKVLLQIFSSLRLKKSLMSCQEVKRKILVGFGNEGLGYNDW